MAFQTRIVQLPNGMFKVQTRGTWWLDIFWSGNDQCFDTLQKARTHASEIKEHVSMYDHHVRVIE